MQLVTSTSAVPAPTDSAERAARIDLAAGKAHEELYPHYKMTRLVCLLLQINMAGSGGLRTDWFETRRLNEQRYCCTCVLYQVINL